MRGKPKKAKSNSIRLLAFFILGALMLIPFAHVSAAQITSRSVTLSDSSGGATGVTYTLNSDALPSSTVIESAEIEMCTTPSGSCTTPSGFSASSSSLASQPTGLGSASGWTVSTATAGSLRIVNSSNVTAPSGSVSIEWDGVANPTATNTTFFARVITYSDDTWSTAVDNGTVALSTSQSINVTATVDETLVFCTGTSITGQNCGTVSGSSVDLGTLSAVAAGTGTSVMAASTNSTGGYAITINGDTLTSGANTIDAITSGSGSASSTGTEQFGINLRDNATPNVGADPSGASGYTYGTGYGTADAYKYVTADSIVNTSGATNATAYTVSYLANIGGATEAGVYSSTFNYIATATF